METIKKIHRNTTTVYLIPPTKEKKRPTDLEIMAKLIEEIESEERSVECWSNIFQCFLLHEFRLFYQQKFEQTKMKITCRILPRKLYEQVSRIIDLRALIESENRRHESEHPDGGDAAVRVPVALQMHDRSKSVSFFRVT